MAALVVADDDEVLAFKPLPSDVVVATAGKAGTTWMQQLVTQLLCGGSDAALSAFGSLHELSPWVSFVAARAVVAALSPQSARLWLAARVRAGGDAAAAARELERNDTAARLLEASHASLAALRRRVAAGHGGRRCLKTHAPACAPVVDACPCVFVARGGPDAVVSLFHHWRATRAGYREAAAAAAGAPPAPLETAAAFFDLWLDDFRGYGAPRDGVTAFLRVVASFWRLREHRHVLLVHFADLKRDARREAARVAAHCGIALDGLDAALDHSSFAYMKAREAWFDLDTLEPGRFLRQGALGGGAAALADAQLARYDALVARELGDDCARWLRDGGGV